MQTVDLSEVLIGIEAWFRALNHLDPGAIQTPYNWRHLVLIKWLQDQGKQDRQDLTIEDLCQVQASLVLKFRELLKARLEGGS